MSGSDEEEKPSPSFLDRIAEGRMAVHAQFPAETVRKFYQSKGGYVPALPPKRRRTSSPSAEDQIHPNASLLREMEVEKAIAVWTQPPLSPEEVIRRLIDAKYLQKQGKNDQRLLIPSFCDDLEEELREHGISITMTRDSSNKTVEKKDLLALLKRHPDAFDGFISFSGTDLQSEEVVGRLLAKSHLTLHEPENRMLAIHTSEMKEAMETLGIQPSYQRDNLQVISEVALLEALEQKPEALRVLLPDIGSKFLFDYKDMPPRPKPREVVKKLLASSDIGVERTFSVKTLEMENALGTLGIEMGHKKGGVRIIHESALLSALEQKPTALNALAVEESTLTAEDVVVGLKKRNLLYRVRYDNIQQELRVRGEDAVYALESVGVNVDHCPGGGRKIQEDSLLKAFGGDMKRVIAALSDIPIPLRAARRDEIPSR